MILAGGHSLLPALAERNQREGHLVDIGRIDALKRVASDSTGAVIGAGVTLSALLASAVAGRYPALAQAVRCVGNHVVRNRSTVGGSVAWADPRGELLLILIALDAIVLTSRREVPAASFATGPFRTVLKPGEAILAVRLPPPAVTSFDELIVRNSTGRATIAAVCAKDDDGRIRLSLAGLVDRAVRGAPVACDTDAGLDVAATTLIETALAAFPVLPDSQSISYRSHAAYVLLHRCFGNVMAA